MHFNFKYIKIFNRCQTEFQIARIHEEWHTILPLTSQKARWCQFWLLVFSCPNSPSALKNTRVTPCRICVTWEKISCYNIPLREEGNRMLPDTSSINPTLSIPHTKLKISFHILGIDIFLTNALNDSAGKKKNKTIAVTPNIFFSPPRQKLVFQCNQNP